jgi:hypothetical protein
MKLFVVLILSAAFSMVAASATKDGLVDSSDGVVGNLEKRENGVGNNASGSCQGVGNCQNDTPTCDDTGQCENGPTPTAVPHTLATVHTTATATPGKSTTLNFDTSGCNRPQTSFILYFLIVFVFGVNMYIWR